MKRKMLFTYETEYNPEKISKFKELGLEVIVGKEGEIEFSKEIEDAEFIIGYNFFNTLDVRKFKNLKWIQLTSIGFNHIPIESLKNTSIEVSNSKGVNSIAIGEWIVLQTLLLMKNSMRFYENQKSKLWKVDTTLLELYGKTVGFVGTGSLALEAAKRFSTFGVKIVGLNTKGRNVEFFDECFPKEELNKMLSLCDVVVITIPSTKETYHLIGKDEFNAMKDGAYFINVARGDIVEENALMESIESEKVKGASLDVFDNEPLPKENKLWKCDNLIITPHNSYISDNYKERLYDFLYENTKRYLNGKKVINIVNLEKGY